LTARNSDVVLIVDDIPDNLAVLHDALDESGYTVLVASFGRSGFAARCAGDFPTSCCSMP
jgi:CheY-like chemotaxis protein